MGPLLSNKNVAGKYNMQELSTEISGENDMNNYKK